MDQGKLLFMLEVRKLALEYREQARKEFMANVVSDNEQASKAFESHHPLSKYIEAAYRELVEMADQIKALQEADRSAEIDAWINDKSS